MLSCSIWFCAPSFWMGGGLESCCVGRVYGADGARHHPHRCRKICCGSTSNAPDDGRMYPKTCRAKSISIKLPCFIKLAFHIISWGRCTVKQHSNLCQLAWKSIKYFRSWVGRRRIVWRSHAPSFPEKGLPEQWSTSFDRMPNLFFNVSG